MKQYEITTYHNNGQFGYTFRDTVSDKYIYTNEYYAKVFCCLLKDLQPVKESS